MGFLVFFFFLPKHLPQMFFFCVLFCSSSSSCYSSCDCYFYCYYYYYFSSSYSSSSSSLSMFHVLSSLLLSLVFSFSFSMCFSSLASCFLIFLFLNFIIWKSLPQTSLSKLHYFLFFSSFFRFCCVCFSKSFLAKLGVAT